MVGNGILSAINSRTTWFQPKESTVEVSAYEGDIVIMGSDGVFDNLCPLLFVKRCQGRDISKIDYIYIYKHIYIYMPPKKKQTPCMEDL